MATYCPFGSNVPVSLPVSLLPPWTCLDGVALLVDGGDDAGLALELGVLGQVAERVVRPLDQHARAGRSQLVPGEPHLGQQHGLKLLR